MRNDETTMKTTMNKDDNDDEKVLKIMTVRQKNANCQVPPTPPPPQAPLLFANYDETMKNDEENDTPTLPSPRIATDEFPAVRHCSAGRVAKRTRFANDDKRMFRPLSRPRTKYANDRKTPLPPFSFLDERCARRRRPGASMTRRVLSTDNDDKRMMKHDE